MLPEAGNQGGNGLPQGAGGGGHRFGALIGGGMKRPRLRQQPFPKSGFQLGRDDA